MSYPQKFPPEKRKEVHELYWLGRETPMEGIRAKGTYTLREIEEITGVPAKTAWMIARGHR